MTGRGSIRHNNRSFSAANVDRSRSGQNVTFCNEDLKKVYHELFDEALAAYNAKKKKTRDKIPDYYEHIRQSKQEKLFHEAIFQIGNLEGNGRRQLSKNLQSPSRSATLICGCSIWCCTWTRPRPTSMWTSCRWQRSRAGAFRRGYQ
mgnify:CR=1 FL=1